MNFHPSNSRDGNKKKIRIFTFNNLLFLFLLYFSYFGINGSNGFFNLIKLNEDLKNLRKESEVLKKEKQHLKIKNSGLYVKTLDQDLLEEISKQTLGYVDSNEIVILTNKE